MNMKLKRIIVIAGSILLLLILSSMAFLYFWIGISVKENIKTAKELYPGNAEDALISLMIDENFRKIYIFSKAFILNFK